MDDKELVARLRETEWDANVADTLTRWDIARHEAADRIEALTDRLAKAEALADALRVFADEAWKYEPDEGDSALAVWDSDFMLGDVRKAAAALKAWETPGT